MKTFPRRSTHYIDREVQGGLLRKIMIHWFILLAANTVALLMWVRLVEHPHSTWSTTFEECFFRYMPVYLISASLLPAFLWDTTRLTNRFAGPIRRLRQALSEAAQGADVQPLNFRNDDYWKEIANDFNKLISTRETHSASTEAQ